MKLSAVDTVSSHYLQIETKFLKMNPFTRAGNFGTPALIRSFFNVPVQFLQLCSHVLSVSSLLLPRVLQQIWQRRPWRHTIPSFVDKYSCAAWSECLWVDRFTNRTFLLIKSASFLSGSYSQLLAETNFCYPTIASRTSWILKVLFLISLIPRKPQQMLHSLTDFVTSAKMRFRNYQRRLN
jgi:hypothetical protein